MSDKLYVVPTAPRIPVIALGTSLSVFLAATFTFAVLFDLWVPGDKMYGTWLQLVPGFTALNWTSFFLGFGWSFLTGGYVALVFAPLFNLMVGHRQNEMRWQQSSRMRTGALRQ